MILKYPLVFLFDRWIISLSSLYGEYDSHSLIFLSPFRIPLLKQLYNIKLRCSLNPDYFNINFLLSAFRFYGLFRLDHRSFLWPTSPLVETKSPGHEVGLNISFSRRFYRYLATFPEDAKEEDLEKYAARNTLMGITKIASWGKTVISELGSRKQTGGVGGLVISVNGGGSVSPRITIPYWFCCVNCFHFKRCVSALKSICVMWVKYWADYVKDEDDI